MRARLILASDRVARGQAQDRTAPALAEVLARAGDELAEVVAVEDDRAALEVELRASIGRFELVLTSGGTGLGPRDVTPEATRPLLERELPGVAEAMRAVAFPRVPTAILSRGLAGSAGTSLVVNLPGSPRGAAECLALVLPALRHASELLAGRVDDCAPARGETPR